MSRAVCPAAWAQVPRPPGGQREGLGGELVELGSGVTLNLDVALPQLGDGWSGCCLGPALGGHRLPEAGAGWAGVGGAGQRPSGVLRPTLDHPPTPHQAGRTRSTQARGRAA